MMRTRINPIRRTNKAKLYARNFGDESEAVRMLPCLCAARLMAGFIEAGKRVEIAPAQQKAIRDALREHVGQMRPCSPGVVAAHVTARGMGGSKGGRFDLVPLCDAHHREAGEARTSERAAFEARYGLELRAEADRIAAAQAIPLGICGLAQRWAQGGASFDVSDLNGWERPEELSSYETEALFAWVRRECEREAERRRAVMLDANSKARLLGLETYWWADHERLALVQREQRSRGGAVWDGLADDDLGVLAAHAAEALGLDAGLAEQLLDAAEVGHE